MQNPQTTKHIQGGASPDRGSALLLAGGLQDERFSESLPVGSRRECEASLPRPFPLSKIYNPSRVFSSLTANLGGSSTLLGFCRNCRPFFFFNRCEQALQSLVQRLWFFHCAFSNALSRLTDKTNSEAIVKCPKSSKKRCQK